jgi:hypothetical protein
MGVIGVKVDKRTFWFFGMESKWIWLGEFDN